MTWFHIFAIVWTLILVAALVYMIVGIHHATVAHRRRDREESRDRPATLGSTPRSDRAEDRWA